MAYQLNKSTAVRARPSKDAEAFAFFGTTKILLGTGKKSELDPADVWVNVIVPPGMGDGWIPLANAAEVADPARPELDREAFIRQCIIIERSFNAVAANAPWLVSADFLIARALIESDMGNPAAIAGSDAVGPLRVSSAEWDLFIQGGKPLSDDFGRKDFDYPMLQIYAAAHRMRRDAQMMSAQRSQGSDPFLPSYLDLFHAHLTDVPTALAIRDGEVDGTKTVDDVLTHNQFADIKSRQPFSAIDERNTVVSFVAQTETLLNDALKRAFELIKEHAPDELPQAQPGPANWLAAARAEIGVTEGGKPERIKSYFAATDFGPVGGAIPHWCGAFVAFCIKASGADNPVPAGAALAANWKTWGSSVPVGAQNIPDGAVVVLTPSPGTNTSGHVAFLTGALPASKQITLLGGNQSNAVNETPYSVSRIAAVRWLEVAPTSVGAATGAFNLKAAGVLKKFFTFGDMIVNRFERAGFTREQQLAALANAIGESGLDPNEASDPPEQSFGLFQCNRVGGLGIGFTEEQLKDPETNIGIIIKEAKRFSEFTGAHSVADAVRAFVRFIERPKHPEADIIKRMAIAEKLSRPA